MHRRTAAVLLTSAAAVMLLGSPAQAHNELTSSDPKAGAQLGAAPKALTLTFAEPADAKFVKITVTAAAGKRVPTAKPRVNGSVVSQPFEDLPSGKYTVAYRVVSADGHPINGSVTFTVLDPVNLAAPAGAPGKEIAAGAPGKEIDSSSASPAPRMAPAASPTSPNRDRTRVFMMVTVALLCLAGIAAAGLHLVSAANRRPKRREST